MAAEKKQDTPPLTPGQRRAKRLFAAFSVLLSIGILEGGLRVIKRGSPFQADPQLIRSLRPNKVCPVPIYETEENLQSARGKVPDRPTIVYNNTNNLGFRMPEDVGPKAPGERRVLLLGDSFTEAEGVPPPGRFADIADAHLRARDKAGEHLRLINAGIQNGAPSQYLLQVKRYLPLVEPELVVIDLAPNDVDDDTAFERTYGFNLDADGYPESPRAKPTLFALQHVYTIRYLEVFLQRYSMPAHQFFFSPTQPEVPIIDWKKMLCQDDAEVHQIFLNKTGRYLRRIKEVVEKHGARLAVFMIQYLYTFDDEPLYDAIYPNLTAELTQAHCYETHGSHYNAFVEDFLKKSGIPFRNPYEAFLRAKKENPRRKLWNYVDYHFSPAGHRVAGEELSALLDGLLQ